MDTAQPEQLEILNPNIERGRIRPPVFRDFSPGTGAPVFGRFGTEVPKHRTWQAGYMAT